MDEQHRRYNAGRFKDDTEEPSMIEKLREYLVPGSKEGVVVPQNQREKEELQKLDRESRSQNTMARNDLNEIISGKKPQTNDTRSRSDELKKKFLEEEKKTARRTSKG